MTTMPADQEKIPLFGSWKTWYGVVLGFLGLLIGAFYWITKHFS